MKVIIVDDHPFIRIAAGMILTGVGHEIVGECDNGIEAVSKTLELQPDVLLLDLDIPLLDGMAVLDRIKACMLSTRVLVYTAMKNNVYAAQSLRGGAAGFLSKTCNPHEIVSAMRAIANGKTYFPIETYNSVRRSDFADNDRELLSRLSRRELRVLHGLAQGKSNIVIAKEMLLSNKTVSTYKTRLMQKLDITSVVALGDFAKRSELV